MILKKEVTLVCMRTHHNYLIDTFTKLALMRVYYKFSLNCHPNRWAQGYLVELSSFVFLSMARNRCESPIQKRILWKAVDLLYGYIRWFFSWRGNSFWTEQDLATIGKYEASCKCNLSFTNIVSLTYDFFCQDYAILQV